jgi:hypothetical protein
MKKGAKVSASDTYVIEEGQRDQLDELSLTTVLNETTGTLDQPESEPEDVIHELDEAQLESFESDPTINELMRDADFSGISQAVDPAHSDRSQPDSAEPIEPSDDLLSPELLFPEEPDDDD